MESGCWTEGRLRELSLCKPPKAMGYTAIGRSPYPWTPVHVTDRFREDIFLSPKSGNETLQARAR